MLTVITGPMFAGKSSKLISLVESNRIAGNKVALFKPSNDNRYSDCEIVTHRGERVLCDKLFIFDTNPVLKYVEIGVDVFIFDEAQFFVPSKIIPTIEELLYTHKKNVIVAGLSQDSEGRPFGAMPHLLAIADDIVHLKAVCSITKVIGAGTRTYRKDKSNTEQVAVGGSNMYEARSLTEWLNK